MKYHVLSGVLLATIVLAGNPSDDTVESPDHSRYSRSAYEEGRKQAEKDIRENRLIIERYGMPSRASVEYANLLQEKYRIELKGVAGCVVDDQIVGHARGYNEVSEAEIERRFGKDVLEKAYVEAENRFAEKRATGGD